MTMFVTGSTEIEVLPLVSTPYLFTMVLATGDHANVRNRQMFLTSLVQRPEAVKISPKGPAGMVRLFKIAHSSK